MLKWNQKTFLYQVHVMMLNSNVWSQNQHRKHEKRLQMTDGDPLHRWDLSLCVFSVDYGMWMSLRMSWCVFPSVCFTSASWRAFLQPETNSSAFSTSPTVHTHSVFLSVHQLHRSLTAVSQSFSMTVNWFELNWHLITLGLYFTFKTLVTCSLTEIIFHLIRLSVIEVI